MARFFALLLGLPRQRMRSTCRAIAARAALRRRTRSQAFEHALVDRRDHARARPRDDQGRCAGRQPRPPPQSGSHARAGRQVPRARGSGDPLADARRAAALRCRPAQARHRLRGELSRAARRRRRAHSGADRAVRSGEAAAAPIMCASTSRPRSRRPPAPRRPTRTPSRRRSPRPCARPASTARVSMQSFDWRTLDGDEAASRPRSSASA